MSNGLFSEFDKVSARQWKQKIQFELEGADYNKSLVWSSSDGVDVKPFYHPDEAPNTSAAPATCGWNICEPLYVTSAETANALALNALTKGAESLWLVLPTEEFELQVLLKGIEKEIPVYLDCKFLSATFSAKLSDFLKETHLKVFLLTDIIGKLARTGNWFHDLKEDHVLLNALLNTPNVSSVLSVNTALYQNAGANIPQQLAYSLAHVNEYFNHIDQAEDEFLNAKELPVVFQVSVSSNYFFEIAKLRALRQLYATLAKEYDFQTQCHILALPSKRNKTVFDYNVNLLRTTTECMSAILGNADSVCNLPYDVLFHKTNEFGSRIARNQLLILKHESYFEKVANPADGSYYIESLTEQFAEKALSLFKEIENGGGFLKQLKAGTIQKKIAESSNREQQEFDEGQKVLIGTNKYTNAQDRMKEELELYPFLKKKVKKSLLQPILERRLAEKLEKDRLNSEDQ